MAAKDRLNIAYHVDHEKGDISAKNCLGVYKDFNQYFTDNDKLIKGKAYELELMVRDDCVKNDTLQKVQQLLNSHGEKLSDGARIDKDLMESIEVNTRQLQLNMKSLAETKKALSKDNRNLNILVE